MKVVVKNARGIFMDVFTAKTIGDSTVPKFSMTLLCSEDTKIVYMGPDGSKKVTKPHAQMQLICEYVMREKFGKVPPKHSNWAYNKADGSTTRDEFVDKEGEFYAGVDADTLYISANKQEEKCKDGVLTVLDQDKQPIAANSGRLFSGCYVNAVLDIYAFPAKNGGKDGVTASLEGVQLLRKGEPLGITQIDAADDFDEEEIDDVGGEADDLM